MRRLIGCLLLFFTFFFLSLKPVSAGAWTFNKIYNPLGESVGNASSVQLGNDGYARIAFWNGTNYDLEYIRCLNTACTSFDRTVIESAGTVLAPVSLDIADDGYARMIWRTGTDLNYVVCTNHDCSSRSSTLVATNADLTTAQMELDSGNLARIAYRTDTTGADEIHYVICLNTSCSSNSDTTVYSGGDISSDDLMHLNQDDVPRFVYLDWADYSLIYLACDDASCSASTSQTVMVGDLDLESAAEEYAFTIGTDGFGRIVASYYDGNLENNLVKFVACTNASCSTKVTTNIDSAGAPANGIAIQLTTANLPRVAYATAGTYYLKYIYCLTSSCDSVTISSIQENDESTSGPSLILGSFDEGHVSYYNSSWSALSFAYEEPDPTPTPTPTNTPTPTPTSAPIATPTPGPPSHSSIVGSTTDTPVCHDQTPSHAPDLFQIVAGTQTATLFFSPVSGINNYYLAFGRMQGSEEYGGALNYGDVSGVLSYQITHLSPSTTYYAKIRGTNGCRPGDWSNELRFQTTQSGNTVFYKDIVSQVLSAFTNSTDNAAVPSVRGTATKPKSCSYTVQPGDSLWGIAQKLFSDGLLYNKIMQLNKLQNDLINAGQKLKVC